MRNMWWKGTLFCRAKNSMVFTAGNIASERLHWEDKTRRASHAVVSSFKYVSFVGGKSFSHVWGHWSFCYILLFSSFEVFGHLESLMYKVKIGLLRQPFRSRLIMKMMQYFLKLEEFTRRKLWLCSIRCISCCRFSCLGFLPMLFGAP